MCAAPFRLGVKLSRARAGRRADLLARSLAGGVFQDALVTADVAAASTLAFVGSTQATMQAVLAIPISRLIAAYGPVRLLSPPPSRGRARPC